MINKFYILININYHRTIIFNILIDIFLLHIIIVYLPIDISCIIRNILGNNNDIFSL
jgi:hypothetical protein